MTKKWVVIPTPVLKRGLDFDELLRTVRYVAVGHVVQHPAERIQDGGVVAHLLAEEPASPKETLTAGGENFFRVVEVVFLLQPQHLNMENLRSVYNKLFGLSLFYAD